MVRKKALPLTPEAFEPFGTYCEYSKCDDTKEAMAYCADVAAVTLNSPVTGIGVLFADPQKAEIPEMEIHHHTEEGWLVLDGPCVSAFGTPAPDPNDAEYKAFLIPAGTALSLKIGVWHFAPLPSGDRRTTVLCLLPPNTPELDIVVKPLKEAIVIE